MIISIFLFSNITFAQCSPNPMLTGNLLYPDTNSNLKRAYYGIAYNDVLQMNVPSDTTIAGFPAQITSMTILGIDNLPTGISWACNPTNNIINGGSAGCILFSGTPTLNSFASYNLRIRIRIKGIVFSSPQTVDTALFGYKIRLSPVYADTCDYTTTCANTTKTLCPDSITNLKNAKVDSLYTQVLQFKSFDTISSNGINYLIDSVKINLPITGLPPHITAQCSNSNCLFTPFSKGCITFVGTPTIADTGVYNLNFSINYFCSKNNMASVIDRPVNYYKIKIIKNNTGIDEYENMQFQLSQNNPNPSNYITEITFVSPEPATIQFKITDVVGQLKFNRKIKAKKGKNNIKVDTRKFDSGAYFYSVSDGKTTLSKTMMITN